MRMLEGSNSEKEGSAFSGIQGFLDDRERGTPCPPPTPHDTHTDKRPGMVLGFVLPSRWGMREHQDLQAMPNANTSSGVVATKFTMVPKDRVGGHDEHLGPAFGSIGGRQA